MLSAHSCPVGRLGAEDTGGMSVYIREIARELGRRGHLVDVYTRAHDSEHEVVMGLGENARLIHLRAGEDEKIHKLAVYLHLPDFACRLEGFRKDNHLRYDLVFSHYWLSAWVGKFLQGWWDVPHMAMFHTLGALKNAVGIGEDEPELRVETERYLIGNCRRIIAATDKEKADIVRYYGATPEAVSVIPCGVNLELFQPVAREVAREQLGFKNGRTILYVGRIEPLKGVDRLVKAMAYLNNGHGPRLVVIGGEGSSRYERAVQQLPQELHIKDSVSFMGLVTQEALPRFYSAADVCVVPSYYESFGLVALESLACGTPVVTTRTGGAESFIKDGETGYIVADNSPRQLARRIGRLLSKTGHNGGSAAAIRASVSRFSWPNIADLIIQECRRLLASYAAGGR